MQGVATACASVHMPTIPAAAACILDKVSAVVTVVTILVLTATATVLSLLCTN
jgi:hypothetical protein